jgi:branched-chain amino acid transport system substrate-binding protein
MIKPKLTVAILAALGLGLSAAQAQDHLKVGVIGTLSGPPAVLGQQMRNGFELAVKTLGGKLGGRDVDVTVADDELKPDEAVTKVKELIDRNKVDFVVGPIFSNILAAIMKPVTEANVILISPMPERRALPARTAIRTSLSPPTRTIRSTRSWANMRRIPGSRR